jgi:hypothetical protein
VRLSRTQPTVIDHGQSWVACPEAECGATAEIIDRHTLQSTDGPVFMVRTRCVARHVRDWVGDAQLLSEAVPVDRGPRRYP